MLALLAVAPLALGGCRLIDQRTFERAPVAPTPAALGQTALPPLPLARLQPASDPTWRTQLDGILLGVMAHDPQAHFDLLTPFPSTATRAVQDRFERDGTADAQTVATALQEDRVDISHITIGLQGDAGKPAREVRLYVR